MCTITFWTYVHTHRPVQIPRSASSGSETAFSGQVVERVSLPPQTEVFSLVSHTYTHTHTVSQLPVEWQYDNYNNAANVKVHATEIVEQSIENDDARIMWWAYDSISLSHLYICVVRERVWDKHREERHWSGRGSWALLYFQVVVICSATLDTDNTKSERESGISGEPTSLK